MVDTRKRAQGAARQDEDIAGPAVIAYTKEDDDERPVREAAQAHAREHGCVVLLYAVDAPGILSDPLPNAIDAEGADQQFGDRLGVADLEYLGRADLARQVIDSRASGARTAAWLPKDHGMAALADYATAQDAHLVFAPEPAAVELGGLRGLEGSGLEVRAIATSD